MHRIGVCLAALVLGTITGHAQVTGTKTLGEELTRLESSKHGDDIVLGDIPEYFVDPQKAKGIIKAIDLEARTIKVIPVKKNGTFRVAQINEQGRAWSKSKEMTLIFVTPKGLEQIKASGQAAKHLGKKSLRLEDIPEDAKVKLEYYPAGPAAREVIVTAVPTG
jgi:hypothetical protein